MQVFLLVCMCLVIVGLLITIAFMVTASWYRNPANLHAAEPWWVRTVCKLGRIKS